VKPVFVGVIVYVLLQLAIGLWVARRIRNEDDYLLAGRSLGTLRAVFTIFATWFGAETCVGAAGRAYESGLSGTTADPFGYGGCILLMAAVFAVPLWRLRLTTLADLFKLRFGVRAERTAVLLLVPTSLLWAAAQIRAFGQVLGAASGWELEVALTTAAIVVIVYTSAGGFLADVWTDLVQGVVLIAGLLLLAYVIGASGDARALAALPPETLRFTAEGETAWVAWEKWAVPILGSVMAQELVARILAARSPQVARRSAFLAAGLYLCIGCIPLLVGLVASQALTGVGDPEQVLILYAERNLSTFLFVLFAGALVSAILSTVDSCLLVGGSLIAHNVVLPLLGGSDDRAKVRINRLAVVALGLVAYGLALMADGVYELVEEASAFGSAGIFVSVVFGLFTRVGKEASALGAMVVGIVSYAGGAHWLGTPCPYLTSLAAATLVYLLGAMPSKFVRTLPPRPGAPA
jgi:SSS family solute:Na+ symporter